LRSKEGDPLRFVEGVHDYHRGFGSRLVAPRKPLAASFSCIYRGVLARPRDALVGATLVAFGVRLAADRR
jgi:hypothetical protein